MNEQQIKAIRQLRSGEKYYVSLGYGSGAEIWRLNDMYFLFEISLFGGPPIYYDWYQVSNLDGMVEVIDNWT